MEIHGKERTLLSPFFRVIIMKYYIHKWKIRLRYIIYISFASVWRVENSYEK